MGKGSTVCTVLNAPVLNDSIVGTSYKIKGGGVVYVKSVFQNDVSYKDALYPAILDKVKRAYRA